MPAQKLLIKGSITIIVDGEEITFQHKAISLYGTYGLSWGKLSPQDHSGRVVQAVITISGENLPPLATRAVITREQTAHSEMMGMRFQWEEASRRVLSELIEKRGYYPADYIRKYPRIPASPAISTFPLRASATIMHDPTTRGPTVLMDIENLSPGGILLRTDNRIALSISAGSSVELMIDPRGEFSKQITAIATVCRTTDELNPKTGNAVRFFGMRFFRFDDRSKQAFLELLKDVVTRIMIDVAE